MHRPIKSSGHRHPDRVKFVGQPAGPDDENSDSDAHGRVNPVTDVLAVKPNGLLIRDKGRIRGADDAAAAT